MPIISQLVASKRKPERVNIFVDGEFALQVHVDAVYKHELKKGVEFSDELKNVLVGQKNEMYVKQLALAFATYKPRTEEQVRKRLRDKECSKENIDVAVEFLREFNYINDAEFAKSFVRDMVLLKNYSKQKLQIELKKRGVSSELIHQAIASEFPHERTEELALEVAQKKYRAIRYKAADKIEKSLRDYLIRQGYSFDIIKKTIKQVLGA